MGGSVGDIVRTAVMVTAMAFAPAGTGFMAIAGRVAITIGASAVANALAPP